jgi:hypothetical protein
MNVSPTASVDISGFVTTKSPYEQTNNAVASNIDSDSKQLTKKQKVSHSNVIESKGEIAQPLGKSPC